ncbi:MAG: FKBP-type peptidyl-prolyl cis-trans isomerase [Rubripirellula sp.]
MPACVNAQEKDAAKVERTESQSIGYFLGVSVGQQMSQNGFELGDIDIEAMLAGFKDGINKAEASMSDDELRETQARIQKLLETRLRGKGINYLAANAKKEGVKELEGGLQYKVLTAGEGESPAATDTVKVHYTGTLIDGTVFDSSVKRGEPATFRVNQVIKGWQMALQEMKVGDKWMLYIPSDLAYGERGSPGAIGPHEVLVFEVELLEIQ